MAHKRNSVEVPELEKLLAGKKKKYVRYEEGAVLYSMGKNSFRQVAQDAHAIVRLKRIALVNVEVLDEYLESFREYGSEQGGKRPVIIIQNDVGNKFAPTVIVAAVTSRISKKPNQPTHVLIDKNPAFSRPSVVLLEQIFTIDKERINNFMGLTSEWEMKQIEEALLKSLGINK